MRDGNAEGSTRLGGTRGRRRGALRGIIALALTAIAAGPLIASAAAATGPPVNTVAPRVAGKLRDGSAVHGVKGTWTGQAPFTYAYQWLLCDASGNSCTEISGASKDILGLKHEDVGGTVRIEVTATNGAGKHSVTSGASAVIAPLAVAKGKAPSISGTAQDGKELTANPGAWRGTPPFSYAYQWESCLKGHCSAISGATGSQYRATTAEIGDQLKVSVAASNEAGSASSISRMSAKITAGPPVNLAAPEISGEPVEGQELTATTGEWAGTPSLSYAYQWLSCSTITGECMEIAGATSSTYTAGPLDVAGGLKVVVTARNHQGSASATSPESSLVGGLLPEDAVLPSITGLLQDGGLLTALTGTWSGTEPIAYTYVWEVCNASGEACKEIKGATEAALGLISSEVGNTIRVVVTATNSAGSTSATSEATSLIGALLPSNTKLPSITGTPIDGGSLTAAVGEWTGTAPISYSDQWQLCNSAGEACNNINGATEAVLGLISTEVGDTVRVIVTATNGGGSTSATSAATSATGALLPSNTKLPSISGTPIDGGSLTAAVGEWTGTAPISYGDQWQLCNAKGEACNNINGATEAVLGLISTEVGDTVRVIVTATNGGGSTSATSAATSAIGALLPSNTKLPSISGTPIDGGSLTAAVGEWTGTAPISYVDQWQLCNSAGEACKEIKGATEGALALISSEVGDTVRVVVTATNGGGFHLSDERRDQRNWSVASEQCETAEHHGQPDRRRQPDGRGWRMDRHGADQLRRPVATLQRQRRSLQQHQRRHRSSPRTHLH